MHMHQGTSYRYGAWMPIEKDGAGPSTNPPYYGHVMVSKFIGGSGKTRINNINLHSDYYSAYAAYDGGKLTRVLLLNLHEWNPSTGSDRPKTTFTLRTPRGFKFKYATVELMTAPGAASTTNITVAGISYDYGRGRGKPVRIGPAIHSVLHPQDGGVTVDVEASQGIMVTFH